MTFTLTLPIQNGSFLYHFSLVLLFLSFGADLVINSPLPTPSPMLQGLKGGKSVVDGAADLGNTGKGVQSLSTTAVGGASDLKNAGSSLSTGSETSQLNVLRGSPDLTGSNLKQTGQLSKFSNPAEMATGASRIGIDTARQTTNTLQGSRSVFSLGSVLKSISRSIYKTYHRIVYRYYKSSALRDLRNANSYSTKASHAPTRSIQDEFMAKNNLFTVAYRDKMILAQQAALKAGKRLQPLK